MSKIANSLKIAWIILFAFLWIQRNDFSFLNHIRIIQIYPFIGMILHFSCIKPEFCNLFKELCEEQVLLYIQGEEVKNRKKQRKVETEVADLRLKLATIQSKNIVLSNREIRLLRWGFGMIYFNAF